MNNADTGKLGYLTTPGVRGFLKTQPKTTVAGGMGFVWDGVESMNSYTALVSNQVASNLTRGTSTTICHACFFADWTSLLVGSWAGTSITIDPYTLAANRETRIFADHYVDVSVRHPESFCYCADFLTS